MTKELSAGGIITRVINGETEILLIKQPDDKFGYPKGHIKSAESERMAAKREIIEETGYTDVVIRKKLGIINRDSLNPEGRHIVKKIVMFRAEIGGAKQAETDETTIWVKLSNALSMFWYAEDNIFFIQIKDML